MAGRILGDAWVTIRPDAALFRSLADAQVKKALAGMRPDIKLRLTTDDKALASLQARIEALSTHLATLKIGADDKAAEASIGKIQGQLVALSKKVASIPLDVDTKALDAKISAEQVKLATLRLNLSSLKIDADAKEAIAKIAALERQRARLADDLDHMIADVEITAAVTKIDAIDAQLKVLKSDAETIRLVATQNDLQNQIARSVALIEVLRKEAADVRVGGVSQGVLAANAALLALESSAAKAEAAARGAGAGVAFLGQAARGAAGFFGALTVPVTLFGGLLRGLLPQMLLHVKVWHIFADALVELIAVWGGATIAATAFGIAASDAVLEVFHRMKDLQIAADATGLTMKPLTGTLEALHNAVRPQVYQLFGDALNIASAHAGEFTKITKGASEVIGRLGGRITAALTTSKAFDVFTRNATNSLGGLGTAFGNLFGAIGNIIAVVPDYAQKLLALGVAFTAILETVTRVLQPVIRWGLALHGAFLYVGLAVTATVALVRALTPMALALAGAAVQAAGYAASLLALGVEEGVAAAGSILLSDALAVLSKVPVVAWAALIVGALTAFIVLFHHASDVTKDYTANLIKMADAVPIVQALSANLRAQADIAPRLAAANKELATAGTQLQRLGTESANVNKAWANSGIRGQSQAAQQLAGAYDAASTKTKALSAGQKELRDQYNTLQSRLQPLVKQTGSLNAAYGVLNAAGITTAQLAKDQGAAWAVDNAQIQGTISGYQAMTGVAGQLNNDLDVLGRTVTDQYQAVQKLNDAWSQFIGDVTSTQGTFDTVAQGFEVLASHSGDLKLSLGKLKATFSDTAGSVALQGKLATATAAVASAQDRLAKLQKSGTASALQLRAAQDRLAGAQDRLTVAQLNLSKAQSGGVSAIDALTPAGIALNQAFTEQVGNIDKLLASWRTAGLANDTFVRGVKDAIAPMVKYANGSQEATAQLIALAQEAGFHGPNSMKELVKWLGNTSNATKDLKAITNEATVQEALLSGAMKSQGDFITNQLIGDINQAILKYNGVQKAATDYGTALAQAGGDAAKAKPQQDALVKSIVAAGTAAHSTTGEIAGMIAKILNIPLSKAIQIVLEMSGKGDIKILGPGINRTLNTSTGSVSGPGGHTIAKGAYIATGKGPLIDDFPALLARGEVVVPASMVSAGLVDHLRGRIPGFAAQRVRPDHRLNPMRYAAGGLAGFVGSNTDRDIASMSSAEAMFGQTSAEIFALAAIKAAQAIATAAAGGGQFLGPGSGNYAADIQTVLKAMGLPLSLTANWLRQIQTESGGNLRAVNLTDSNAQAGHPSVGLLQLIPGTFAAYAGPYINTPPLVNFGGGPVSEDPMAQIYAAIHYAAARYGGAGMAGVIGQGHGYKYGGLVGSTYDKGGILPPWKIGVNTSGKAEMVTPAQGSGSLQETNMLLRQMIHAVHENTRVTGAQGQQFAHGIGVATSRGALRGYYGG